MTLHLFNPENDLALASRLEHYTPPAAAVALGRAGALIPAWLAGPGDAVLVDSDRAEREACELRSQFGLAFTAVTEVPASTDSYAPWGWSLHARRRFIDAGADKASLPDDLWLDMHRSLSSRLTTIQLCNHLGLEPPVAATDVATVLTACSVNHDRGLASYLKMPWSSSGRGVFPTTRMDTAHIERLAADIIRSQGAVVVEPDRRRVTDFAVLYRIEGGRARFHALSLFATDGRGAYRGNLVISDDAIVDRLGADPMPWAEKMSEALTAVIASGYTGWAGVDMVVTDKGAVYPLIELNLRATMGVVASAMRPHFDRPMLLAPSPFNPRSHLPLLL